MLLSAAQLHSGLTRPLLDETGMQITYLEKGHIFHLRDRLRLLDGSIWIENIWTPALQREQD